jgi:hypothetical protein
MGSGTSNSAAAMSIPIAAGLAVTSPTRRQGFGACRSSRVTWPPTWLRPGLQPAAMVVRCFYDAREGDASASLPAWTRNEASGFLQDDLREGRPTPGADQLERGDIQ